MKHVSAIAASCLVALVTASAQEPQREIRVAVFNFHQKSGGKAIRWMEKGIADRLITDFFQSGLLMPVQRDAMQSIAEQMKWAPEMMTDPGRLQMIQKALEAQFVVSGVYEVKDGNIVITANVVQPYTGKEVARKQVTGQPADVLGMMRRLSAQLLAWFHKGSVEEIMTQLPAWTRSIPAARAVYEGVDLYDQGRFHEAWLKFRQASQQDAGYAEAKYWVGRMYYFMHRYRHAVSAYEAFLSNQSMHPRAGDAIKEYVHCHEAAGVPPDELISLYQELGKRFQRAPIRKEMGVGTVRSRNWLRARSALLCRDIGRLDQAIKLAIDAHMGSGGSWAMLFTGGILRECVLQRNRLFGTAPTELQYPEGCVDIGLNMGSKHDDYTAVFDKDGTIHFPESPPQKLYNWDEQGGKLPGSLNVPFTLFAESQDTVFTRVSFKPEFEGGNGEMRLTLSVDQLGDVAVIKKSVEEARQSEFVAENLPATGIMDALFSVQADDMRVGKPFKYRGMRMTAVTRKVESHGSILVQCLNATDFVVKLDGKPARLNSGLIGFVTPGKHTIQLERSRKDTPLETWSQEVAVEAGKTVTVNTSLPWKRGSPWAAWQSGSFPETRGEYVVPTLQKNENNWPSIQADDEAIRLVWARRGDLWTAISHDGQNFTEMRKLDPPVSSGWMEDTAKLIKDKTGRFVLTFMSDRNVSYIRQPYVCWSRDFVKWSAPVMVVEGGLWRYDMIQDRNGRFVWVGIPEWKASALTIRASDDGYRWTTLTSLRVPAKVVEAVLFQGQTGPLELYVCALTYHRGYENTMIWRYWSQDGVTWQRSEREMAGKLGGPLGLRIAVVGDGKQRILGSFEYRFWHYGTEQGLDSYRTQILRGPRHGVWPRVLIVQNIFRDTSAMAYYPKWGYMIAWTDNPRFSGELWVGPVLNQSLASSFKAGDIYFIRGPGFDKSKTPSKPDPKKQSAKGAKKK